MSKKWEIATAKDVNQSIYHQEWRWQEGDTTVTRSAQWTAPGCHNGCSVLFYVKDGKLVDIEGDPNSPYNQGRLCMRCLNMVEAVNHPNRLKYPIKRVGERGENKWARITWDEAYDMIEQNVRQIWADYGAESIVGMQGTGRNVIWITPYLCYAAFKTPNFALGFLSGDACYLPRASINQIAMGDNFIADCSQLLEGRYDDPRWTLPEYILIWGNNPIVSNGDGFFGHWIVDCMKRGSKLIVADPKCTWLAARAEHWLRLRPGSDAALALSMVNVIIEEDLYDHDFVENWCYGFDDLRESAAAYPPDKAAELCWVEADDIRAAARAYAAGHPSATQWGLAVDQQVDGIAVAHALISMMALCGNIDVPGGSMIVRNAYNMVTSYNCGRWLLPPEAFEKQLGLDTSPMHANHNSATANADAILKAIETDEPYPVRMLFLQATNPIANMAADAPRVYRALKRVPFIVHVDVFLTPTAVACADLVLPAAMSCERNSLRGWWWPLRAIAKAVDGYEDSKTDEQIILDIGKRLAPENFPWDDPTEMYSWQIKSGANRPVSWPKNGEITWEELRDQVISWPEDWEYKKYEKGLLRLDGKPGFNTPSGKVEFSSILFDMWDLPKAPYHEEPPEGPFTTPELMEEYPFVLTSGLRSYEFFHSEHRNFPTMREFHPDPLFYIHPTAAAEYGIADGDWVWIENIRGKCRQRACLDPSVDPRVINAEHGWWFPEQDAAEPSLFGVFDSNINNLTPQCVNGPTGYGAPYKSQICKIYKDDGSTTVMPTEYVTKRGGYSNGK